MQNKDFLEEVNFIKTNKSLTDVLYSIPNTILIVSNKRELLFSNKSLNAIFEIEETELMGKLFGEVFNCVNAGSNSLGCGFTKECELCGAFYAINEVNKTRQTITKECRILSNSKNKIIAYDLSVTVSPLYIDNIYYNLVTINDISVTKRKKALEKIFYHDILNTVGSLNGLIQYIPVEECHEEMREVFEDLKMIGKRLVNEIITQRDFEAAENGELEINLSEISSLSFINDLITQIQFNNVSNNRIITLDNNFENTNFSSDKILLSRIIINILKNALEASKDNEVVKVGCKKLEDKILFWINNPAYIEPEIQMQIFQRNFSTKGNNRGIGTFSMKLLAENYLNGKIYFTSTKNLGTTFYLEVPIIN